MKLFPLTKSLSSQRIRTQQRHDKNKLYALHAPEVECISKGKAHTSYEFGVKVSLVAAFAYRFDRRFNLRDLVAGLIVDVARTAPVKERIVRAHAEAGCESRGSSRFIFAQRIRYGW